jgi:hypothetical protein
MQIHAVMAGAVAMTLIQPGSIMVMSQILFIGIILNLLIIFKEINFYHDTTDTKKTIVLMTKGYYSKYFWVGVSFGNLIPLCLLIFFTETLLIPACLLVLIGIFLTEFVRIRIPQMIPLS